MHELPRASPRHALVAGALVAALITIVVFVRRPPEAHPSRDPSDRSGSSQRILRRVVDGSGHPIPGATISRISHGVTAGTAVTDPDGQVDFDCEPSGTSIWIVSAGGYQPRGFVGDTATTPGSECPLDPALPLHVQVVDERAAGRAGVQVRLTTFRANMFSTTARAQLASMGFVDSVGHDSLTRVRFREPLGLGRSEWLETTDAHGRATFRELPSRVELFATISRAGELLMEVAEPIVIGETPVDEPRWTVSEPCDVHGILSNADGTPLADTLLWFVPTKSGAALHAFTTPDLPRLQVRTDGEGRFTAPRVPSGDYYVGPGLVAARRDDALAVGMLVRVPTHELRLEVPAAAALRGFVLDQGGTPRAGATVVAALIGGEGSTEVTTRSDGSFEFGAVPVGRYRLRADDGACACSSTVVEAETGDAAIVIEFVASAHVSARMAGSSDDDSIAEVVVVRRGADVRNFVGSTNPDRRRDLGELPRGVYDFTVRSRNGAIGSVSALRIDGDVEVPVEVAPGVGLELECAADGAAVNAELFDAVGTFLGAFALRPGDSRTVWVPIGDVRVDEYRSDGAARRHEFTTRATTVTKVRLAGP